MATSRPYRLVKYDPTWIDVFNKHADKIKDILGPTALEAHHIGSTSVPGMMAKPNIDVEVVVSNLDDVRKLSPKMVEAGYQPHGDYSKIGEEYFTEDASDGERRVSIHVLPAGNLDIRMQLDFRDYLRTHEADRELYSETKRRLFAQYHDDYGAYDSGKKEVIEAIKKRAVTWA